MKTIEYKSERIATRVTPSQKDFIARAASLRGRSLTDFIIDSAQKEAANAIGEAHTIQLSGENQLKLAKALMSPSKPNDALKKAATTYDKATINSQ